MSPLAKKILELDRKYPAEKCPSSKDGTHHKGCGCDLQSFDLPGLLWLELVELARKEGGK